MKQLDSFAVCRFFPFLSFPFLFSLFGRCRLRCGQHAPSERRARRRQHEEQQCLPFSFRGKCLDVTKGRQRRAVFSTFRSERIGSVCYVCAQRKAAVCSGLRVRSQEDTRTLRARFYRSSSPIRFLFTSHIFHGRPALRSLRRRAVRTGALIVDTNKYRKREKRRRKRKESKSK